MLKVLVASSKGGAGKTTIATNLAAHYAVEGKNTVLVDADRQGSSQRWAEKRAGMSNPVLGLSGLRRDWARHIPEDAQRVVVDSAAGIRSAEVGDYLDGTGTRATDPLVSPIFADLRGLPPLLIQVGSHEVLLDDAVRLAARAAADDVAVTLDVTPGVPHVFQAFAGILDEGDAALDRVARFVADHLA